MTRLLQRGQDLKICELFCTRIYLKSRGYFVGKCLSICICSQALSALILVQGIGMMSSSIISIRRSDTKGLLNAFNYNKSYWNLRQEKSIQLQVFLISDEQNLPSFRTVSFKKKLRYCKQTIWKCMFSSGLSKFPSKNIQIGSENLLEQ